VPSDTSIIAPLYHVQSTAAELRSGFPYFGHHDSISALWSQKWRMPCVQGIYPFTEGGIQDFEPIFAELIRVSGNRSEFLYQPDEYAKPFFPVAEKLVAMAGASEADGDTVQARDLYLRAAAVYRIARFPINRSPMSQEAWERESSFAARRLKARRQAPVWPPKRSSSAGQLGSPPVPLAEARNCTRNHGADRRSRAA
jgi:hypothetical protein